MIEDVDDLWKTLTSVQFQSNVLHTGQNALAGLSISLICVLVILALVSRSQRLEPIFGMLGLFTKISPAVAYVPFLILVVADAVWVKILTASLICLYPLLVPSLKAFSKFPDRLNRVADTYNAPFHLRVGVFGWAWLLAGISEGLVTAAPLAVVGSIVADYVAGGTRPGGIGQWIQAGASSGLYFQVFVGVLGASALGCCAWAVTEVLNRVVHARLQLTQEG